MTRINLLHPSELHQKHLSGEIHEITRVFGLVRKAIARKINKYNFAQKVKQPKAYTMGEGHVLFFYNKLGWVADRYEALYDEWEARGYSSANRISREELLKGIDSWWQGGYTPTPEAIEISRQRIMEMMPE